VRVHGTTKAVPMERFATDEQPRLTARPPHAYRSLLLEQRAPIPAPTTSGTSAVPHVVVERRSLATYAALASAVGEDA
jgi:hypothetical protein